MGQVKFEKVGGKIVLHYDWPYFEDWRKRHLSETWPVRVSEIDLPNKAESAYQEGDSHYCEGCFFFDDVGSACHAMSGDNLVQESGWCPRMVDPAGVDMVAYYLMNHFPESSSETPKGFDADAWRMALHFLLSNPPTSWWNMVKSYLAFERAPNQERQRLVGSKTIEDSIQEVSNNALLAELMSDWFPFPYRRV